MLKYGKLKEKSAFKMYAKANNIPFELSNEIVKKIDEYNKVIKYIEDEEEKELISIYDYIGEEYREIYDESLKYQGIIQNASISPCSFLLYDKDIIEEIGIVKLKDNICCCIDGKYSDMYKYLKNDLLTVAVVKFIQNTYKRIGIEPHTLSELEKICENDEKVWEIYEKGFTMGINQFEQDKTKEKGMNFKPSNISEISDFVG